MWIFPGNFNTIEMGYANIDTLFIIAPWVFLFLAPAITMRSFSEEQRTGTLELLLTKPLTEWQIVSAKYLASLTLVFISLLPTLVYYYSVSELALPKGNVDHGAILGSYLGLIFLAAGFVAIGVFASSISSSQIVSFIIAVFLSFFCYLGFESIAALQWFGPFDYFLEKLSISEHYNSMSRGVIDTRDVVYFLSIALLFLSLTKLKIESRKW
jgi:ABC-2 type transport system permease protein